MPKYRVTLTRWVLENAVVEVEAEDLGEVLDKADEVYRSGQFAGEDLKWEPSTATIEQQTHSPHCKAGNRYAKAIE